MEALLIAQRISKAAWEKLVAAWKTPHGREVILILLAVLAYFVGRRDGRLSVPRTEIHQTQTNTTTAQKKTTATTTTAAQQTTAATEEKSEDKQQHVVTHERIHKLANGEETIDITKRSDSSDHMQEAQQVQVVFNFQQLARVDTSLSTVSTTKTETSLVQSMGTTPRLWDFGLSAGIDAKHPLDGVYLGAEASHYVFTVPWVKLPVYVGGSVVSGAGHVILSAQLHAQF